MTGVRRIARTVGGHGWLAGALTVAMAAAVLPAAGSGQAAPAAPSMTLRARSFQPGELVVVQLTVANAPSSVAVHGLERVTPAYRTGDRTWEALVGIDLDQEPGRVVLTAHADGGAIAAETTLTVLPHQFPVRRLRVNPTFVDPPPDTLARIADESRFLREVYAHSADERLWSGAWARPVPHRANSRFGSRSIFNGRPRSPHSGADFLSPEGTPVHAPNAGRIVAARDMFFNGQIVIIDHGLEVFSQLLHLSRIDVGEGDAVATGQVIGLVGATGRVTGAHLHWGLRIGGARVDPLSALALLSEDAQ